MANGVLDKDISFWMIQNPKFDKKESVKKNKIFNNREFF